MSWIYGLIEDDGELKVAEIYFDDNDKPKGCVFLSLHDVGAKPKEFSATMLADDIRQQLENGFYYKLNKNKIVHIKKVRGKNKKGVN